MCFCVRRTLPGLLCQSLSIRHITARCRREGTWRYGLSVPTGHVFVTPHIKCKIFLNFDIILAVRNIQPYSAFSQVKIPNVKLGGNTVKYFLLLYIWRQTTLYRDWCYLASTVWRIQNCSQFLLVYVMTTRDLLTESRSWVHP